MVAVQVMGGASLQKSALLVGAVFHRPCVREDMAFQTVKSRIGGEELEATGNAHGDSYNMTVCFDHEAVGHGRSPNFLAVRPRSRLSATALRLR